MLPLFAAVLGLSSCGLVKMPFRVAGAMVEGTARAGKKAVDSTSNAMERRRQAREAEKKAEEKKAENEKAENAAEQPTPVAPPPAPGDDYLPPLPDLEPPLPDDAPLPY